MSEKRVQFSNIVQNQLPDYVRDEYPLISEFLKQYYIGQEYVSGPLDLIQNIDQYTKVGAFTNLSESVGLKTDITSYDDVIPVDLLQFPKGTVGFPTSYGLIKIDDEVITYTGTTKLEFTGCVRGFSGITSYKSEVDPESVVFESTNAGIHSAGATITNLSCLFLKEFLLKTKHQILPGLEERPLSENVNKNVFIKQSKDFYLSKGTDRSFEILFKALYEEDVKIIRPGEYLTTPSNALYRIENDLVVEPVEGNPEDLTDATLYQDEYVDGFTKGYAPITNIEKVVNNGIGKTYYKLSFDAGYNRDLQVDGSLYGNFKVHPQTKLIGQVAIGQSTFDVDSTVGFSNSGELRVEYNDDSVGVVSYTSKSLTQFYGCTNVDGIILDKANIGINTFAWGRSFKDQTQQIKVRINSVLSGIDYQDNTTYYLKGDTAEINTLGVGLTSFKAENWIYNIAPSYIVNSIELIDSSDYTYRITLNVDQVFRNGDKAEITSADNVSKSTSIISIVGKRSFDIKGQGELTDSKYTIKRHILKAESNSFPSISKYVSNVQNVYKEKYSNNLLVASSSIPSYNSQPLNTSDRSVTFSGTYSGEELDIGPHSFYTGDIVYYIPQKVEELYFKSTLTLEQATRTVVKSSLFASDIGILVENQIPRNQGIYFIKRINSTTIKLARSVNDINNSKFISIVVDTTVTDCIIQTYSLRLNTLGAQKLLREVAPPQNDGILTETVPGFTGLLINGVEILNYKSTEVVHCGKINSIEVSSPGLGYDVINPQPLAISDNVGTGATGFIAVSGSLKQIQIIDPGFDYQETPTVRITGGNGSGAIANVRMTLITHKVPFNSQSSGQEVGFGATVSTIGFSTYHKFKNAEKVSYVTDNQEGIVGLITNTNYFVSTVNNTTVKLHHTQGDAITGINTVVLTSGGVGRHSLQSYDKKSVVEGINVSNPGSGYANKKRTAEPIGINTYSNEIVIKNHGYENGEIVKYVKGTGIIGGLSDETEYYLTKVNDNTFKLSSSEFLYKTKQYIDITSSGSGTQTFNYPPISVSLIGKVGISSIGSETFEAKVQPIVRGEITSIHLSNNGVGYGSSEIIGYKREPEVLLTSGTSAQIDVIATDGVITELLILSSGRNYTSIPDLVITGDGVGAILTPIIENGSLSSVKIISGGKGYTSAATSIAVLSAGSGVKFNSIIQTWRVNLFNKYYDIFTDDDGFITEETYHNDGLQYSHLYAPRKLRENVYAVNQSGDVLYGTPDLKRLNGIEVSSQDHSPIIGWAYDGNPIYGPYGYSTNSGGVVTQMKSGYKIKTSIDSRPSTDMFPPGFFIEDHIHYDVTDSTVLDENNGRFCITPEFPNGTYAYFTTLEDTAATITGPFRDYKIPVFPYIIGKNFYSGVNNFNYLLSSNQGDIDLQDSKWIRNTKPYNLIEDTISYDYVNLPNSLNQTMDVKGTSPGKVNSIGIGTGGDFYKIGDNVSFDSEGTGGYGASARVSRILGKPVTNISVASSSITGVEIFPGETPGEYIVYADSPHNLQHLDIVNISGLSTTGTEISGAYPVGISSNKLSLVGVGTISIGIASAGQTGIVTYMNVAGKLGYPDLRENDILGIGTEKLKVLNISPTLSRIRVIREYDGTVGQGHTAGTPIYEDPRKFTIDAGFNTTSNFSLNRQLYFNPSESVGLGTSSGVGAGTTLIFTTNPVPGLSTTSQGWWVPPAPRGNPGWSGGLMVHNVRLGYSYPTQNQWGDTIIKMVPDKLTRYWIQSKRLYIPNHGLETGDKLTYSSNGGDPIVSWIDGSSGPVPLTEGQTLYAAAISGDLVGIATVRVGMGTEGTFVGIASTYRGSSTLFFSGFGTGTYHSFQTNFDAITGEANRQLVTVATSQTHGLKNNDTVFIDVNPSIAVTYAVQYNDFNRSVLVGIKTFTSAGVNTTSNTITITDHGFTTGEKIVHTAATPIQGLSDNGIYYIVKIDNNNFKLSDTYYNSTQRKPIIVGLGNTSNGSIGPINPPLTVYKDSTIKFDLSDPSLAWTWQGTDYSAFEFNFYADSDYIKIWDKNIHVKDFNVKKTGRVGIDADANVTLTVNKNNPEILYYKLSPVYDTGIINIDQYKEQVIIDSEVISNNEVQLKSSLYNGKQTITIESTDSFTYTLPSPPEKVSYASTNSEILSYETNSSTTSGQITKFQILDGGKNYYELPGITTITSTLGKGADIKASSNSLGEIKKIVINNIGFDFPSDKTLNPSISLSQTQEIVPLMSLESVGITSVGRGYTAAPELIVLDGKTGEVASDVDLDYNIEESQITILKNAYGLYNVTPTILPIHNTNGVGISTVGFNTVTKSVTVTMASGFSTANSFPFAVNDKVMIEGISVGVGSTGKGYDSSKYNYKLFTLTAVDANIGGIGTVAYSLADDLDEYWPGQFDPINSTGRIIPEKYFPVFNTTLKSNDYIIGETVTSSSSTGVVDNWNNKTSLLRIQSNTEFRRGDLVVGSSSKTQGIASSIRTYEAYGETDAYSKVENGWSNTSGVLNNNSQRIQDSDYYQNFSYSLNSRVAYETWNDVVSSLNHTLGFKKFSDLQIESSSQDVGKVGLTTDLTSVSTVNNLDGFGNLNCVSGFDLAKTNSLNLNGNTVSTEIIFSNRILQDYMESKSNRVLSIDDISPLFNSHPRPTRYSIVDTFSLDKTRCRKLITYVRDKRYYNERQIMLVNLVHDGYLGYMNQYGRLDTVYDQGSFDFKINGTDGEILFYPTRFSVNDYWVTTLSYNLDDNILGMGSTSIGSVCATAEIETKSTSVSAGTTTTVVSIANTYASAKILVEVTPDISSTKEFEYIELNIVHNGTDIEMLDYGQLTTNSGASPAAGYGTYFPYFDGSLLKVDFTPNAGIGTTAAVNTIVVGLSSTFTGSSGVGTVFLHHSKLETTATRIAPSGSPTANVIGDYVDTYDGAYCIIQVRDLSNSEYQLSEFAVIDTYDSSDGSGETYDVEWADIRTGSAGLGTIGSRITSGVVEIVFTPNPSIDTEVIVFMNAIKYDEYDSYPTTIDFTNSYIKSGFGDYTGTDSDIMRAFNLTHNNDPIFERSFLGNDSSIVNISSNTINIPNHFYVVGEKIKYYHVGIANSAIGITTTTFPGIGSTEYLPEELFAVPINDDQVQIAATAEDALKPVPTVLDFTHVGIGTSHRFVAANQNARIMNAIDNVIQSPIVSTAITCALADQLLTVDNLIKFTGITSFYGGDLIKIGNEIMKIEGVGIGSTNIVRVRRPWLGTSLAGYGTGDLVTKVIGNYNIVDNILNFSEAPHGNRPIGSTTNPPDDRDWTGITTSSTFQGRSFMKGGVVGTTTDTYSKNYIFDDISQGFDGISNDFTLKSNGSNISGISSDSIILINDIWQGRGNSSNYTLEDSAGVTTITFVGTDIPLGNDVNRSNYPVGGVIVSVGSSEGFGYQPLVAAGGTALVSTAGTITSISIGYSGSGYRSGIGQTVSVSIQQESVDGTNIVAIGTAAIGATGSLTGVAVTNSQVFYAPKTITNVGYNSITGMTTVTTSTAHGLSVGNEVVLSGIALTCTYSGSKSIAGFAYSAASGIVTVTTSGSHGYSVNQDVIFTGIGMTCDLDPSTTHTYPRTTDPYYTGSRITAINSLTEFVTNVGVSTVPTFYASGGTVQGVIVAPRVSDPAAGQATVSVVLDDNNFLVNTGVSTRQHLYARGGKVNKPLTVLFDDPLSYSNIPLIYSSSSVGAGTSAVIDIQVGQGSSVIDFELKNTGYAYGAGEVLTVSVGGTTGIPTTSAYKEFNITVDEIFSDEFTGWSIGLLQTLDNVEKYIDGTRVTFPLSVEGDLVSILSSKGSKINIEDVLIVFVNDILQKPGSGYTFPGGSNITFTEPLKKGDTVKISFYKGGSSDVLSKEILETVKVGDTLEVGYDPSIGQESYLQQDPRTVTKVPAVDYVNTMPYYGPGNSLDSDLIRPVDWCRQTEDKIINEQIVGKDRELYEPNINPLAYIIKSVGIGSTTIFVDNIRPFFDAQNENDTDLSFQNSITLYNQDKVVGASATAVVSGLGTISSVVISDGGVGYTTATVSIASTVGIGTTTQAFGAVTIGTGGTVTGVAITSPGVGYTNTNVPSVLISPPSTSTEIDSVSSYNGDSGVIVGFGTDDDSGIDKLIFDFFIPDDSYLRDPLVVGTALTLSTIQVNDFFVVTQSNVGFAETSLVSRDVDQNIIGIGTQFVDNVYQVSEVSIVEVSFVGAEASKVGIGTTIIARVKANISGVSTVNFSHTNIYFDSTQYTFDNVDQSAGVSGMNTIGGGTTSSIPFGNFSWGRIELDYRTKSISYPAYTLGGIGIGGTNPTGIHTSPIVARTEKLKSKNYTI